MTDTPVSSTNPIDKFSSLMIKTFLVPVKALLRKTKPAGTASETSQNSDVSNSDPTSMPDDSLTNKALSLEKKRKLPKLPNGMPTKKVGMAIGIMAFILILLNLSLGILRREPQITDPTPVPTVVIDTSRPSIYAEDTEVLGLEEKINVLDRELSNVVLRDTTLRPPELDFNINF